MVGQIDASSRGFITSRLFSIRIDLVSRDPGLRVYHAGMTTKLEEKMQELNIALLKVIEKDSSTGQLSEQLESKTNVLTPFSPFF
jgi:hypothetical protein